MNLSKIFIAFCLLLLLNACAELRTALPPDLSQDLDAIAASLAADRQDAERYIDKWTEKGEYGKALKTIDQLEESHPSYQRIIAKREAIQAKADAFEAKSSKEGQRLARAGKLQESVDSYLKALSYLPDSQRLQDELAEVRKTQASEVALLDYQLYRAQLTWLIKAKAIYTDIATIDAKRDNDLQMIARELKALEKKLVNLSEFALEDNNLTFAFNCLALAQKIESTEERQAQINQIQNQLDQLSEQRINKLIPAFEQAIKEDNLLAAQQVVKKMEREDKGHPIVRERKQQLESIIQQRVEAYINQGATIYSQGNIEQAIEIWERAEELQPDNEELNAHLSRARRALENLEQLRKKQQVH